MTVPSFEAVLVPEISFGIPLSTTDPGGSLEAELNLALVGSEGPEGPGVPVGGTTGQILAKASNTDFDTEWIDDSPALVSSVNGQTGAVVLDAIDIGADPAGTAAAAVVAHVALPDPHTQYFIGANGAIGANANNVALGSNSNANALNATAVGEFANAPGLASVALGRYAEALGTSGTAIGSGAYAQLDGATALGSAALASGLNSLAVGGLTTASHTNAVALGAASVTGRADEVSVGGPGSTRFIANVRAGENATDAVNLGQLSDYATLAQVETEIALLRGKMLPQALNGALL